MGGVGVSEGAGPLVVTVGEGLVVPAVFVLEPVVVPAQGGKIVCGGGPALSTGVAVIEITIGGGHSTSREHTPGISGGDGAAL